MADTHTWVNHHECLQSCALAGAAVMAMGITDAYAVANGPTWCYFYAMKATERPGLNVGQRFLGTYPANSSIVFGAEKDILETLRQLPKGPHAPGVVLVENSCAFSLIGDDLEGIVESARLPSPAITMDSGGVVGDFWKGYRKALQSLLQLVDFEPCESNLRTVNFIGCAVTYYNEPDDLAELARLLESVGIQLNIMLGHYHTFADVKHLKRAALNVVIHDELGLTAAQWLADKLDMPYINPGVPYGLDGTIEWVQAIADVLNQLAGVEAPPIDLSPLTSEVENEKTCLFERLREMQRLCNEPWFDAVVVAGPGSVVKGLERTLTEEWLDAGEILYVPHDEDATYPSHYLRKGDSWKGHMAAGKRILVLGSDQERRQLDTFEERLCSYITVAQPGPAEVVLTTRPFVGIRGNRVLYEAIWRAYVASLESSGW